MVPISCSISGAENVSMHEFEKAFTPISFSPLSFAKTTSYNIEQFSNAQSQIFVTLSGINTLPTELVENQWLCISFNSSGRYTVIGLGLYNAPLFTSGIGYGKCSAQSPEPAKHPSPNFLRWLLNLILRSYRVR